MATIFSSSLGGDWDSPETWVGGVVPTVEDDVIVTADAKDIRVTQGEVAFRKLDLSRATCIIKG